MGAPFSQEAKEVAAAIIREENLNTYGKIMERFKVTYLTARRWAVLSGIKLVSNCRTLDFQENPSTLERKFMPQEKKKPRELPFVEPDPGVESFKTEKDALEYYKLRAEYLENLYMLADSPTDVKRKTLRMLDERVRERMKEEQK